MNVTILAALFTILIIAFFAFMDWACDRRNAEIEAKCFDIPAYKRRRTPEQQARIEADLDGYKPTVREYCLPRFEL